MRMLRKIIPISFLIVILFLSACGSSLQKPSGLENNQQPEASQDTLVNENAQNETDENEENDLEVVFDNVEENSNDIKENDKENDINNDEQSSSEKMTEKVKSDTTINIKTNKSVKEQKEQKEQDVKKTDMSNKISKPKVEPKTEKEIAQKETTSKDDKPKKDDTKKPEQQKEETPKPEKSEPGEATPEIPKLTIVQSIVISNESGQIPLPPTKQEFEDDETVLGALIAVTQKHQIQMNYRGGKGSTGYVDEIANKQELDEGPGSGWLVRINGQFPGRGAGVIKLNDGDRIEWLYTRDLGADLN